MKHTSALAVLFVLTTAAAEAAPAQPARRLSRTALEDKIRGGWAGQMIGVSFGAPTEFHSNGKIIEGPIRWQPEDVSNAIVQDDLYVEMTFAEVMDRFGLEATSEQYGEMFKDSKYALWHANAAARRLLNRGIKAPFTGHPKYNAHANDIDFQIESDFIGLMTPGLPREANKYADRVGRVMNYGDGLYGGMFFAGMYAAAFFESDPEKVVRAGLLSIPEGSGYATVIRDVLAEYRRNPADWKKAWQAITDRWDKNDPCPDGALRPFNIDARLNGAWVALGLLYGHGDVAKTLDVATRSGQDSDCNPSSALGVLGVILGYEGIPDVWKAGIPRIATTRFDYTSHTFQSIVASTLARAYRVIEGAGGQISATEVVIPAQTPQAPALEQWDVDPPTKRAERDDPAWNWGAGGPSFRFSGTGVALVGTMTQAGGRADVFLDGEKAGEIDAYIVPNTNDNDLWHVTGLHPGEHTVRVVARADKDPRSSGTDVPIELAIVYGK